MKKRVLGEEEEMEEKSSLRRAQSLRSVSTGHVQSWTEAGLRDRRKSVSQLVAQYQNSPGRKTKEVNSGDINYELNMQFTPIPVSKNESETTVRKSEVKERSRVSPLSRSKSMDSLPLHRPVGTTALRALFESKITTQPESKKSKTALESVSAEKVKNSTLPSNKDAEDTKPQVEAEVNNSHNEQEKVTEEVQVITKSAKTKQIITRSDRRKTISGICSEKISSPEEDKRRSVADFRDNSALYGLEEPSISVKALSALYLSKVAAAEPVGNLLKPEQNLTSPTGKRPNGFKMAEGVQNSIAYAPESNPPIHNLGTSPDEQERPFTSPPPTREAMSILHQRRQKCELRRLLKHTYPELKNVDSLVEEELADILNMDLDTGTGYQSEVQSRCWLFENHEISSVDIHDQKLQMKKEFQEGDIKRTVCMFEQPTSNSYNEDNKPQLNQSEEVTSEQSIKVDVKATRRMFETQSMDSQNPCPTLKALLKDQKLKSNSETDRKETSDSHHNSLTSDLTDTNEVFVSISKAKQIFETISHDKENISPTNDNFSQEEELLKANVRNRAQMFESTPLDKINQQTKEESETILENTQETLVSLCNFSIVHSDGTILEANETGHVKKARYHFIQEDTRPETDEEETVTGSIKNIMLQMLPGANLNPTVTFLKEDSQGNVEIQKVDVPIHQLPFTQDKECRTANVVQITEDLLSQEKSLRKGVLIQDGTTGTREITVYALFNHSEDSTGVMEFGKIDFRVVPSSLRNIPESENCDLKTDISSSGSSSIVDTNRTSCKVQLFQSCIEKGDLDHLKCLQETSSDVDIGESTGESEKTSEIIPGKVNNIKALFTTNIDDTRLNVQSDENKSKVSPKESLVNNENDNAETTNQSEHCPDTGENLKKERILQNEDIMDDGVVLQAELVDVVEDDELVNLQTAIMNLHQATMEAKALQQSVQAKYTSQTNQTEQICDSGSMTHEFTHVKNTDNVSGNEALSQFNKTELEEESKEDAMRGSIQAALDSLGKSNFNVTKGDFRAAMIYRNSGKGKAGHKKTDEVMMNQMNQPSDSTKENKSATSSPVPPVEKEALKLPEGSDTTPRERPFENSSPLPVSLETPAKNRKIPIGPKPAIPPKPDHLKIKPNPLGSETDVECLNKCQVPPTSSKPPAKQIKEFSTSKPCPSHEDALCKSVQHTDANEHQPSDTSVSNTESPKDKKLNGVEVVETPKSSSESIVNESPTGFHATLQNFGVKPSGSVPPVKPKRIKMAKENVKNTDKTNSNSTTLETETVQRITPPHNNDSSGETFKTDSNNREQRNDKSDYQQVSGVVRREKKIRGETEDERRQRLSAHMDEIMKGNVPAVMDIFDKLKKQEELKNILSKVEEIEEDTNKVDVSSLKNIFESMPDWVVPREKKIKPKIATPEHTGAPSEPEKMTSMEVAFGDLEKAGAEIIRLKDQTLERLMDIEEAIKKALYSVSTLKSDSDIVGLSGLFRESMVAVQGSPPSGNIRKISIGSSKSPKALNQIGKRVSEQKKPELFIPTTKQRSASPVSPSFISIQSAARKPLESPSPQISPLKEEPKEETKLQCCCSVPSDRRQCSVTKGASSSPANPRRQVSVLEVQTRPEGERVVGTKTISENYERMDCFGNKFYSSKTSTVVTTQPETRTTSKKLIMSSPATSEIVTYPRINTPFIREDRPPL